MVDGAHTLSTFAEASAATGTALQPLVKSYLFGNGGPAPATEAAVGAAPSAKQKLSSDK